MQKNKNMHCNIMGDTIQLRQFDMNDFNCIRLWVNDKAVTKDLMDSDIFEHYHTEEETLGFLKSSLEIDLNRIRLVIAGREDNSYLGQLELFAFNENRTECEVDIVIANPNNWSLGIGSEAISLICNHMVEYYGIKRFRARIKHSNNRALKVAEKTGFKLRGVFENYSLFLKAENELG
ncbi:GNAT family N-acetyltransferase [Chitinispirillales bacterium ANBcel5]|uniref:GNAT family N-acetyltransferase n=1 Tax=Cellulosispirillum alkaliphilum TaxID=3039283 RepID=UPI002A533203|nr:GNAT family N-acetyltransferase [Chitinispirillales bacterium ANBcel5]